MDILQKELDEIRNMWNTHSIVKSRSGCQVYGVPDELFYIPDMHGKLVLFPSHTTTDTISKHKA